jgi:hypothetical protein
VFGERVVRLAAEVHIAVGTAAAKLLGLMPREAEDRSTFGQT